MNDVPMLVNGHSGLQSIYASSTTPVQRPGTKGVMTDGRVFYYAWNHTTAAITLGELQVTATVTPDHHDQTVNAAADFTAGSRDVVFNPAGTAIVLEEYLDGYVGITDGTGEGFYYPIQTHDGNAGSAQSNAKVWRPVVTTTGGSATMSLVRNPYLNVQQSNTTISEIAVGVPQATLAAATTAATATALAVDPTYGWLQTWGPCLILCDAAITAEGESVGIGTGAVGRAEAAVDTTASTALAIIGHNLTPFVDNEFQFIDLRIRP